MGDAKCPSCGKVNGPDVYSHSSDMLSVECFSCGETIGYVEK